MARLFVVVATGNMVANLPLLFELAAPETDHVLWLESKRAIKQNWVGSVLPLLEQRGFAHGAYRESMPDSIQELIPLIRSKLEPYRGARDIYLIANGGTKIQFGELIFALQSFEPQIAYSDGGGYTWQRFTHDWQDGRPRFFEHAGITLDEVLACRNSFQNGGELIWDAAWDGERRSGSCCAPHPYGENVEETVAMHDASSCIAESRKRIVNTDLPAFSAFVQTAAADTWWKSLTNFLSFAKNSSLLALPKTGTPTYKNIESLYQSTLNNSQKARGQLENRDEEKTLIGGAFEAAVAKRVVQHLNRHYDKSRTRISQVYLNAKINANQRPSSVKAETDVLLVTQSGILLHLECKTFSAEQKDLDARIANLHETGSDLARMSVVMPIFTAYAERDWMEQPLKLYERLSGTRLNPLPFTLPEQGATLRYREQDISIPAFEVGLSKLLGFQD